MGNQTNNRTSTLFKNLLKTPDLGQFVSKYSDEMKLESFSEYITQLCKNRSEVPEHIINRANIERSYGHQIFRGSRRPSRDTVLQLAFGFNVDIDGAQELLRYAGKSPLYPRVKRDAAIIFCLHNSLSIVEAQAVMQEMELPLIGEGEVR